MVGSFSRPLLTVSVYPAGARLPPGSESESSPLLCRVPRLITRSVPRAKGRAGFTRGMRGVVCTRVMYSEEGFKEEDVKEVKEQVLKAKQKCG
jgi:hypothetical protein